MQHKIRTSKKLTFGALVVLGALIVVFAAAEVYLRCTTCLGSKPTINPYVAHPRLGWLGRPRAKICRSTPTSCARYRYNNLGFRGADHYFFKPQGTLRILVLGDSFVEGYQFPDGKLMTDHLQKIITERLAAPVEVINMGISGWGTAQQLLAYQQMGRKLNPDLVILVFSTCNDVINASETLTDLYKEKLRHLKPYFTLENNRLELHRPPKKLIREVNEKMPSHAQLSDKPMYESLEGIWWFLGHTRVGYWLWTRWNRPSNLRVALDRMGLVTCNSELMHTTWGQHGYYRGVSLRFWIYLQRPDPLWSDALKTELQIIERLSAMVKHNKSRFLLVSGANIEQVEPAIWNLTLRSQPVLREFNIDLELPEKTLKKMSDYHHIAYLSLLPAFRQAAAEGQSLFLRGDGHWNEQGQKKAAETIVAFFEQQPFIGR